MSRIRMLIAEICYRNGPGMDDDIWTKLGHTGIHRLLFRAVQLLTSDSKKFILILIVIRHSGAKEARSACQQNLFLHSPILSFPFFS